MDRAVAFQVASNNIHSQIFDDEAVVMDMTSGLYFSLRGAAVAVWSAIMAGATRAQATAALAARYDAPDEAIAAALDTTLKALNEHGLIVPASGSPAAGEPTPPAASRGPLEPPTIERFTDMQELLLLDPIHEVSEAGWPVARSADGD